MEVQEGGEAWRGKRSEDRSKRTSVRVVFCAIANVHKADDLHSVEKIGSWSIGILLVLLAIATLAAAITGLVQHTHPDASNASLIISASALVLMILIWAPKVYLARALNSSTMQGEATCSLSCIQITIVLFVGALVYRVWKGGWWVDSATSIVLGLLFAREGYKMIQWVRDPSFDGGCCKTCKTPNAPLGDPEAGDVILDESYKDLCDCCVEKSECKEAGFCVCGHKRDSTSLTLSVSLHHSRTRK